MTGSVCGFRSIRFLAKLLVYVIYPDEELIEIISCRSHYEDIA